MGTYNRRKIEIFLEHCLHLILSNDIKRNLLPEKLISRKLGIIDLLRSQNFPSLLLTPWYAHLRLRIREYKTLVYEKTMRAS